MCALQVVGGRLRLINNTPTSTSPLPANPQEFESSSLFESPTPFWAAPAGPSISQRGNTDIYMSGRCAWAKRLLACLYRYCTDANVMLRLCSCTQTHSPSQRPFQGYSLHHLHCTIPRGLFQPTGQLPSSMPATKVPLSLGKETYDVKGTGILDLTARSTDICVLMQRGLSVSS